MPIYAYTCKACGYSLERICNIDSRDATWPCPECKCSMDRKWAAPSLRTTTPSTSRMPNRAPDTIAKRGVAQIDRLGIYACGTGIVASNTTIRGNKWTFKGNKVNAVLKNCDIHVEKIDTDE